MNIKHSIQYSLKYSMTVLVIFTAHAMHNQDFTQYLMMNFGITASYVHSEDYTAEFYETVTQILQQKTLYELVLIAHAHSKLLATTPFEDLLPVKQKLQALIQKTIEHTEITQEDIKQLEIITEPKIIRFALSVLSPLQKDNYSDTHTPYINRLMLMLRLKLSQATRIPTDTSAQNKKASLRSYQSQPSADWIVVNTDTSEELYQEVTNEMINTVLLTEEYIKKNNQQHEVMQQKKVLEHTQDTLVKEYSVTRSIEHDLLKILHDYQTTSPTNTQESLTQAVKSLTEQRQTREQELDTRLQQKKLLEQTSEQLRDEIASIAQLILDRIDSTTHKLQAIESEKIRLNHEKHELIKEQASIQIRLACIDTYLDKLNTTEQQLLAKQESHKKAKKALATAYFTSAVNEGKLLPQYLPK